MTSTLDQDEPPPQALPEFPSQMSLARRTDVMLRSLYPHLSTRIFEVESHRYLIVFDREQLDATSVAEHFDHHVRPVSVWLEISNQEPTVYLRELQPIPDRELSHGFEGFSFSYSDIANILISKFPDLPIPSQHSPNQNNPITLTFEQQLTPEQELQVQAVLNGILPGWPITIACKLEEPRPTAPTPPKRPGEVDIDVKSYRQRPKAPSFVRDDEAFWFTNVDPIFEGRLPLAAIPGAADAGMACYIDASVSKQIDLRHYVAAATSAPTTYP